ncbi:MAG: dephospho-CoA kinase [Chloroflexi bacterium]|nr:MAG: dephospho-CoA kinase [Chloroflexi bacterium OLB13]MBV6436416.1 Dephospho-CoA kinase [Anaerolineae bacterium]MCC6566461.1 dephospho-CoA kinase [Chloroflexota bacterium]MBW7880985.1 dephospho-CoA kinase [Anaerolineae bacterium]MCO6442594.1 dephospho-CoA kinase [Anaerolineae bacterium]
MSHFPNKYLIGLTGNIAVGKSTVRQMLQHLGGYPIDADSLAHQAMQPGAPAYKPIVDTFGAFILNSDKSINRGALGAIAFSNPLALQRLEQITHPIVRQAVLALVQRAKQRVVVIEAIKLLEGDLAKVVDEVWVVNAKPETQYRRLLSKRSMTPEEAKKRILGQGSQAEKLKKANVIIENDGNVEETWKQVQKAWNHIVNRALDKVASGGNPLVTSTTETAPIPLQVPVMAPGTLHVGIKRGMPTNADRIAAFMTHVTGKPVNRMDVMLSFGNKSFLMAHDQHEDVLGIIGWQVENLITRCDELVLKPNVPVKAVIDAFVKAVEEFSRELESEVGFVFLPMDVAKDVPAAFAVNGYQTVTVNQITVPAWREAVTEAGGNNLLVLEKRLRKDRVLKPI